MFAPRRRRRQLDAQRRRRACLGLVRRAPASRQQKKKRRPRPAVVDGHEAGEVLEPTNADARRAFSEVAAMNFASTPMSALLIFSSRIPSEKHHPARVIDVLRRLSSMISACCLSLDGDAPLYSFVSQCRAAEEAAHWSSRLFHNTAHQQL